VVFSGLGYSEGRGFNLAVDASLLEEFQPLKLLF
jgi:hypothetical protein